MELEEYLARLNNCKDTSQLLQTALKIAEEQDLGIETIRYYRLRRIQGEETLVSVDAAGHIPFLTNQLRLGAIQKVRHQAHDGRSDGSFTVIDEPNIGPVVFQIDPDLAPNTFRAVQDTPFRFFELAGDGADSWLGPRTQRNAWVEVPLRLGGHSLGKLACSLKLGRMSRQQSLSESVADKLNRFYTMAGYLAPFLDCLRGLEVNGPLEEAGRQIFACDNYESLYAYCTQKLMQLYPFDFESADILVTCRDTLKGYKYPADRADSEALVLRGTSMEANVEWVNKSYYRRDPTKITGEPGSSGMHGHGLTPWVWRNGIPLSLNLDPEDPKFEKQLRAYDENEDQLTWVEHIKAAEFLKSLLIVPIPAPPNEKENEEDFPVAEKGPWKGRRIIGVIRFANKKAGTIEPREMVLLQRIAERCLGPKLISLRHETFALDYRHRLGRLNLIQIDTTDPLDTLEPQTSSNEDPMSELLKDTLGEFLHGLEGKMALVNIRENENTFSSVVVGGDLAEPSSYVGETPLKNTLTDYLIENSKPNNPGYVFINDLNYAEKRKHFTWNEKKAVCALASPIQHDGVVYGGLIVLSDQFNILPASYGQLMTVIGSHLGFLYKRRAALAYAACISGLHHDSQDFMHPMYELLEAATEDKLSKAQYDSGVSILNFWGHIIKTHCQTGPVPIQMFENWCLNESYIEDQIKAASTEAWRISKQSGPPSLNVEIPEGLKARVEPHFLTVCLFNLLKNAWEHSAMGQVQLIVRLENNSLEVRVKNSCDNDPTRYTRLRGLLGRGLPSPVRSVRVRPSKGVGVSLVQRLAEWHRLFGEDGIEERSGQLDVEHTDDTIVCFLLRLPCRIERGDQ